MITWLDHGPAGQGQMGVYVVPATPLRSPGDPSSPDLQTPLVPQTPLVLLPQTPLLTYRKPQLL